MLNNIRGRFSHLKSRKVVTQALQQMQVELLSESTLDLNYVVLILGSCAIATLGLLSNSAAVIIGAMLIAPLRLPIRGLVFGALEGHVVLFSLGLIALTVGTHIAVFLAPLLSSLIRFPEFGTVDWPVGIGAKGNEGVTAHT